MCRFVYYQGQQIHLSHLLTEPKHSLIHQSFHSHEREEPLNGDGFGIAWFAEEFEKPALFKSVSPAWSNQNLVEIARVTRSGRMLAHVRAATRNVRVSELNCHPFRFGQLIFMHNGDIGGFERIRRDLLRSLGDAAFDSIYGSTDSEHFFGLIIDRIMGGAVTGPERLADAVRSAVATIRQLTEREGVTEHLYLNTVLTDGVDTVVTRYTTDTPDNADSLYILTDHRYVCDDGQAQAVACELSESCVIVSSEPLTPNQTWSPIPVGSLVTIDADRFVEFGDL